MIETHKGTWRFAFVLALIVLGTWLCAVSSAAASDSGSSFEGVPIAGKAPMCGGSAFVPAPNGIFSPGQNVVVVQVGTASVAYMATFLDSPVPCPGPPASISILAAERSTCGSSESLTIEVVDKDGFNVKDETAVTVTSSLGTALSGKTRGGLAVTSLILPTRISGIAEVTVAAGDISARRSIEVVCG